MKHFYKTIIVSVIAITLLFSSCSTARSSSEASSGVSSEGTTSETVETSKTVETSGTSETVETSKTSGTSETSETSETSKTDMETDINTTNESGVTIPSMPPQGAPGEAGGQGGPGDARGQGGPNGAGGPGGTAPSGTIPGGQGGPGGNFGGGSFGGGSFGGGSQTVTQGTSANTISNDGTYTDTTYKSTGDDENALRVDGATVVLDGITVDKSAGSTSNTESGDFYGMNAALLATDGANVTITNATVTSNAQNGNGVFSYGSGTIVTISDSTITTYQDNSGGIQTTGGGTTYASNLTVKTSGNSSAAIRSDRGGGTVFVTGGTYTSNGYNSPAVYSTANITVSDATLTANNSEALVIEGKNSITLENCTVYGNMSDTKGTSSSENVHNVMIYQSMSGDAAVGTSSFSMTGGTLTSNNGDIFYITNTACTIELSNVTIKNLDTESYLFNITGNSATHGWGTAGSNGAQATITCSNQVLEGDIRVDEISTLDLTLSNGSSFTGTINVVANKEGGSSVSNNAVITIEEGCTWTLTGDCTISSLTNNGTVIFNGYTITLADGTILSK